MKLSYKLFHSLLKLRSSYINTNLRFKELFIEKIYEASKINLQILNHQLLCFALFFLLIFYFPMNPLSLNLRDSQTISLFSLGLFMVMGSFYAFPRVKIDWAEPTFLITIIIFIIGSGESILNLLNPDDLKTSSFWFLGILFQTASMLLIVARISWRKILLAHFCLQAYMWTFQYRGCRDTTALTPSFIIHFLNILLVPALSYCGELHDKRIFLELRQKEQDLEAIHIILKNIAPTGLAIFQNDRLRFLNNKLKEMFSISKKDELMSVFSKMEVKVFYVSEL